MPRLLVSIVLALLGAAICGPDARAAGELFGVTAQGGADETDFARMQRGGVRTLRVLIEWRYVEPAPGRIDLSALDRIFAAAARHGVRVAPFVYGTPDWLAPDPARPPIHNRGARRAWRSFLTALVERYGRHGELWRGPGRSRPVRQWQIWNEPNLSIYWRPTPAPSEYARLLRISAGAVRAADRRAEIVLAGLARTRRGIPVEPFLAGLLSQPRIRSDFDVVALHPYAARIATLRRQIGGVRALMAAGGERRTPLAITELGWASAGPRGHALVRGPRGQARMLRRSFELLRRGRERWSLERVEWFAWRDATGSVERICDFCRFAGLLTADGVAKPAWKAFRRFGKAR